MFTYSNGYWEVYSRFSGRLFWFGGGGEWALWEDLSLEEYVMGEEKFNEGGTGFSSIIIKKTMKKEI